MESNIRRRIEKNEHSLSHLASKSDQSKGRDVPDKPHPFRTEFQRDRDRIIHSNAFRRMKHKTQVFIAPTGDHYVTRLTHTLEVTQISRTIARALNLNEDLVEAIGLGHDIGHTPFGHLGEEELAHLSPSGFEHARQSVRIVEHLEKNGKGLNLTREVRDGMGSHSKPRGDITGGLHDSDLTLEAQICRISDAVAYLNHDIGDAVRAGIISEDQLPKECKETLGSRHSERIDTMVSDIVNTSWQVTTATRDHISEDTWISMSDPVRNSANALREFMFQNVYLPAGGGEIGRIARSAVNLLYNHFSAHPNEIPNEYHIRNESPSQMAIDFVSGMTDYYALSTAERLDPHSNYKLLFWPD